jgi:hypothetical protein
MEMPNWLVTKINDLTLLDAIQAHESGINFICGDGRLKHISSMSSVQLLDILRRKEA